MPLLRTLESIRTPWLDTAMGFATRLGEEMILIVLFCALFWCISKRHAYVMGAVFFLSSLAVQGLKIVFRVPRPWVYDPSFTIVGEAYGAATGYAFPSGHTQNAAAWLGSLGAMIKKWWVRVVCFGLAGLVAFTRLYLGVHYLQDVLVSLAITFAIVWLAMKFIPAEATCMKREVAIAGVIILCAFAVIIVAAVLYHGGVSEARQIRDATRAAGAGIAFALGMFIERNYIKFEPRTKKWWMQPIKLIVGIAITVALQEGLRVMGSELVPDALRYFFMVFWIMGVYPVVIKKFFQPEEQAAREANA
ncbi:MAG: phosphatase PAP2 family protein [Defluviitaleaceae bacterium]|nr:phosphatase PAP2 family protein [Defluviitaleaceae bacterium]